jgi:hypothetical protein
MPPTLFDSAAREQILARVDRLTPDRKPLWGQMDAGRMVAHVTDQLRAGLGELPCAPRNTPMKNAIIKRLVIYVMPFPKGLPTAPEMLSTVPATWDADVAALRLALDRFGARDPKTAWPEHPAFGRLTGKLWGVLSWRHMDHHLRQFGV